jgi:HD-like signal output (HDOD) protein
MQGCLPHFSLLKEVCEGTTGKRLYVIFRPMQERSNQALCDYWCCLLSIPFAVKNFLRRLLGDTPPASDTSSFAQVKVGRPALGADASGWAPELDIDGLFFNWLFESPCSTDAAPTARSTLELTIIGALQKLCGTEMAGSQLLPRVPSVLPQLLKSLRDENVSSKTLAEHISKDMVLVAELIHEVNSAYFKQADKVSELDNAVRLLGQNGLRLLLAKVSFRPIMNVQSGHLTKMAAPRLWAHADKCAMVAAYLAKTRGQDEFAAYLAGLMQNVGLVVACRMIDYMCPPDKLPRTQQFRLDLINTSRQLSCSIAAQWDFPDTVIDAMRPSSNSKPALCLHQADLLAKIDTLHHHTALQLDDPLLAIDHHPTLTECLRLLA